MRIRGENPLGRRFAIAFTFYSSDDNDLNMPVACLSACVKQAIADVQVYLAPIFPLREEEQNSVSGYIHRISRLNPDLVAISCPSSSWKPLEQYLLALNQYLPQIPVLIGGYQPILFPEETINHQAVDFICIGDGELPLTELILRMRGKREGPIQGLWEQTQDGTVIRTEPVLSENLAAMPFPDYTIFEKEGTLRSLNMSNFSHPGLFILPVMSGRGCPYKCTYCSNNSLQELYRGKGRYLRKYDPESLVKELCRLRDCYDVQFFEFWDELFMFNMKFVWKFFDLYRREIHLPFSILERVENMDETFCKTAAEAGCSAIWFGVECGDEEYRRHYLNRKMTNKQILRGSENAHKFGIQRLTFNMVGMPFETRENLLETLAFNQAIQPEFFAFFVYLPLRGTALYDLAEESGLLLSDPTSDYLDGYRRQEFQLNIREHPGSVTNREFNEICNQMVEFANQNNRLKL